MITNADSDTELSVGKDLINVVFFGRNSRFLQPLWKDDKESKSERKKYAATNSISNWITDDILFTAWVFLVFSNLDVKGIVRRKLGWVKSGINR